MKSLLRSRRPNCQFLLHVVEIQMALAMVLEFELKVQVALRLWQRE